MDNLTEVQRLLRLKRYETPAPEYFEDFLTEFHQRQRAELLKRPLWRLVWDRLEASLPTLPSLQVPRYAFAGSCAVALLVAGTAAEHILTSPAVSPLAVATASAAQDFAPVAAARPSIDFYTTSKPAFRLAETDFDRPRATTVNYTTADSPRYILDSQPASYGQPFSF